ncbi:MAG: M48 family metallopeptidase [Burkholderiaceae bacterium]|nr:M48 family metallopeptidase [Burkholderiaceae bacterium]
MATTNHKRRPPQSRRQGSGYPVQDLRKRALAWAVKLRVNPRVIRVQDMRHKWGSCTSQGTVTLAHDLVYRSDKFQDYVIVHELLHMRYANHGRVFKALMSAYVPTWRRLEADADSPPAKTGS